MKHIFIFLFIAYTVSACSIVGKSKNIPSLKKISSLKLIGEFQIPNAFQFDGTTVGGLSGIDYNIKNDLYYIISDDRSAINSARFYTAKIYFNSKGIDSFKFINVTYLKDIDSSLFPNSGSNPYRTPDPESIRFNVKRQNLIWSSEGERKFKNGNSILENPAIYIMNKSGNMIDSFILPKNMYMQAKEMGPRTNGVFEGLSFANHFRTLYCSVEEPIFEDGPRASVDSNAFIRIIKFNTRTKKEVAQYAYQIDAIPYPSFPVNAFKINGVSEILTINNTNLLIMERAFSTGRLGCTIKIYIANLKHADNISNVSGYQKLALSNYATKKLLLNFETLGKFIDNVEGITWGPILSNGHKTLICIVDDNFEKFQKIQCFVFEVIP